MRRGFRLCRPLRNHSATWPHGCFSKLFSRVQAERNENWRTAAILACRQALRAQGTGPGESQELITTPLSKEPMDRRVRSALHRE